MSAHPSEEGLLDTSVVISLSHIDPASLPAEPSLSTITLAELSVGPLVATSDEEREARQGHLDRAEAAFDPIPFDSAAARQFGSVSSALRASGRKSAARAYDALIAAVALANDMPIYTANARDFVGIPGLEVHEVETA